MRTWTATTTVDAKPEAILDVLTDPEACRRWAPVSFDVSGLGEARRLASGSRARVTGRLAGRSVGFDVEVLEAHPERLSLQACGPVALDVAYELAPATSGSEVRASVSVRSGGGLFGRVAAEATSALLGAGLLNTTISRIAREATC
jgi:Polyketide cyclase / dehydrase and lipid transport